jgi:hypothetical protein
MLLPIITLLTALVVGFAIGYWIAKQHDANRFVNVSDFYRKKAIEFEQQKALINESDILREHWEHMQLLAALEGKKL